MSYFDYIEYNPFDPFDCFDLNPGNALKNDSFNLFNQEKEDDNDKNYIQIDLTNKNTQPTLNLNPLNESNIDYPNLNENHIFENDPEDHKKKILRGRKRKISKEVGEHNKYSEDNIIRKIKSQILNYLRVFINSFIKENYNGNIGHGKFKKEILKINQEQVINDKFNKNLINKTLKDIFSHNLSKKYSTFDSDHNKKLIELLLSETDEEKKMNSKIYLV